MFKIYQLKINGIEPFRNQEEFSFGPFFTLIRGGNGAGKTTVLESLALLGHCSVMERSDQLIDDNYNGYVKYTIILGDCIFDGEKELEVLARYWRKLLGKRPYLEITVRIFHEDDKPRPDLKADLKDEDILKRKWKIVGKEEEVLFLQKLVAFSRPEMESSEEQQREKLIEEALQVSKNHGVKDITKQVISAANKAKPKFNRPQRSDYLEIDEALPPFISYFNTDMYHFGLGIDIRESPKHLSEELSRLVKDRLHLVDNYGWVKNFELVQDFWDVIYKNFGKETLESIWFDDTDKAHIKIRELDKNVRGFLSSGENQTLSLGLVFGALKPNHSIIMLDEPDLHLSLPAALNMYNEIYKKSMLDSIQVISVSHLPFIFPQALHGEHKIDSAKNFHDFYVEKRNLVRNISEDKNHAFRRGSTSLQCLTLYYLNKTTAENGQILIDIQKQKRAAEEAGKFQNHEIDSILRQSKDDPPTLRYIWKDAIRLALAKS